MQENRAEPSPGVRCYAQHRKVRKLAGTQLGRYVGGLDIHCRRLWPATPGPEEMRTAQEAPSRSTDGSYPAMPATYIPDILEEHVEELALLWGRRPTAAGPRLYAQRLPLYRGTHRGHRDGARAVGDLALPLDPLPPSRRVRPAPVRQSLAAGGGYLKGPQS